MASSFQTKTNTSKLEDLLWVCSFVEAGSCVFPCAVDKRPRRSLIPVFSFFGVHC